MPLHTALRGADVQVSWWPLLWRRRASMPPLPASWHRVAQRALQEPRAHPPVPTDVCAVLRCVSPAPFPAEDQVNQTLRSQFCLCPSGAGWGRRVMESMLGGCVPVVVQGEGRAGHGRWGENGLGEHGTDARDPCTHHCMPNATPTALVPLW